MKFTTIIENKSNEKIPIYDGTMLVLIMRPGQKSCLDACDPRAVFAAYEAVTFEKDGSTSLTPRPGFIEPDLGQYVCVVTNIHGKYCEELKLGKQNLFLLRGIPKRVVFDLDDKEVINREIRLEIVEELQEYNNDSQRGYYRRTPVMKMICIPRDDAELEEIKKLQAELEPKKPEDLPDDMFAPKVLWKSRM